MWRVDEKLVRRVWDKVIAVDEYLIGDQTVEVKTRVAVCKPVTFAKVS
jgi:hypothetical protein